MTKRPTAVRVICIIGFTECAALPVVLAALFFLGHSAPKVELSAERMQELQALGSMLRTLVAIVVGWWAIMVASMVGMWRMRKWGPILLTALVAAGWLVWLKGMVPGVPLADSIMAVVALFYLRDMTWKAVEENPGAVEQGDEADER